MHLPPESGHPMNGSGHVYIATPLPANNASESLEERKSVHLPLGTREKRSCGLLSTFALGDCSGGVVKNVSATANDDILFGM